MLGTGRAGKVAWSGAAHAREPSLDEVDAEQRRPFMLLAARRPAPIAWITVAAPVTMSPPAKTPASEVASSSSVAM
jgi:hypothetical protein